jgi:hypothetical protein
MSSDHETEIRASVAAHQDLGSGYDEAVAEGLVERIGEEIDKRIDARLGPPVSGSPAGGAPGAAAPAGPAAPAGYGVPGYPGYAGPMLPPGYQPGPPPVRPSPAGQRSTAITITALGSIGLGVVATAVVAHATNSGGQGAMVLLIWAAITIINIVYARHR